MEGTTWQGMWQPLGAQSGLQPIAIKETGTSILQPQVLNLAINRNKTESDLQTRTGAFRQELILAKKKKKN